MEVWDVLLLPDVLLEALLVETLLVILLTSSALIICLRLRAGFSESLLLLLELVSILKKGIIVWLCVKKSTCFLFYDCFSFC